MPANDEDGPRLAEIGRMLQDFRSEFRATVNEMVRKDVYAAQMAALQLQIDALGRENQSLRTELDKHDTDRRSVKNLGISSIFAAAGALVVALLLR